jgi:pilus assembly protein Flp/PilA
VLSPAAMLSLAPVRQVRYIIGAICGTGAGVKLGLYHWPYQIILNAQCWHPLKSRSEVQAVASMSCHLRGHLCLEVRVLSTQPSSGGSSMIALARKFWNDESGQGLAEYALLLGLIVIGVVVLIQGMGVSITKIFNKANTDLKTAADNIK